MYDVMETIKAFAAESATVIVGTVYDEELEDNLRVTIVATGLGKPVGRQQAKPLTVVAQTPMVVRVVSASDFAALIARVPPLAIGLIRQLGGRTRTVLDELACARQGSVAPTVGSRSGPGARASSGVAHPPRH
jgi:CRP-like cAMP-binding protein